MPSSRGAAAKLLSSPAVRACNTPELRAAARAAFAAAPDSAADDVAVGMERLSLASERAAPASPACRPGISQTWPRSQHPSTASQPANQTQPAENGAGCSGVTCYSCESSSHRTKHLAKWSERLSAHACCAGELCRALQVYACCVCHTCLSKPPRLALASATARSLASSCEAPPAQLSRLAAHSAAAIASGRRPKACSASALRYHPFAYLPGRRQIVVTTMHATQNAPTSTCISAEHERLRVNEHMLCTKNAVHGSAEGCQRARTWHSVRRMHQTHSCRHW